MKKIFTIWLFVCVYALAYARTDSLSVSPGTPLSVAERNALQGFNDTIDRMADDFVEAYVVVAEPGGVLYASFGHAMLHLKCPAFGMDYFFTYESEDIQENWGRFLQGDLKMGMFATPPDIILNNYRQEDRGVTEYRLNLSPVQKQELWRAVDNLVALGADRPYDYYHNGCAVSIVDIINQAIKPQHIQYNEWPDYLNGTLREIGYRSVTNSGFLWNRFALMTLAGSDIDGALPKERKLIIPSDLVTVWQKATLEGKNLLDSTPHVLVSLTKQKGTTHITPLTMALLLFFLSLISLSFLWIRGRLMCVFSVVIDYLLLTIQTFLGAIVCYTVFFSPLPCTEWNSLIIPFNILPVILWHWRRYWVLIYVAMVVMWVIAVIYMSYMAEYCEHILIAIAFCITLCKQCVNYTQEK